jgi:hypothetical protein
VQLKDFLKAMEGLDPEMEVVVRISVDDELNGDVTVDDIVGEYAQVTDDRNVMVEYGRLVVVGDLSPE